MMAPRSRLHLLLVVIATFGVSCLCQGAKLPTQEPASPARARHESGNGRGLNARVWIAASSQPGPEYRAESDEDEGENDKGYEQQGPYGHKDYNYRDQQGPSVGYGKEHRDDHQGYEEHKHDGQHSYYGKDKHEQYSHHEDSAYDYSKPKEPYSSHDEHKVLHYRGSAGPQYGQDSSDHPEDRPPYPLPADRQHQLGLVHHGPDGYHGKHDDELKYPYQQHHEYQVPQPEQHEEYQVPQPEQHEEYNKEQEQHDDYAKGKEQYSESKGHDSYDDRKGSYEPEPHHEQYGGHEPEPYPEHKYEDHEDDTLKICLHESYRTGTAESSSTYLSNFQCCTAEDAPGACLVSNTTDDGYPYTAKKHYQRKDTTGFVGSVLNPDQAAICTWNFVPSICPPHLLKTCLGSGTLNCTLSATAAECGCPFKTLSFTAQGWFIGCEAESCEQSYAPIVQDARRVSTKHSARRRNAGTTDALFTGTAWTFQGDITNAYTPDGYQVGAKGEVEFVAQFGTPEAGGPGRRLLEAADSKQAPAAVPAVSTKPAEQPQQAPAAAAAPANKAQPAPVAAPATETPQLAQKVQEPKTAAPAPATKAKPTPATQQPAQPTPAATTPAPATKKQQPQVPAAPVPPKVAPAPVKMSAPAMWIEPQKQAKKAPAAQAPKKPAAAKKAQTPVSRRAPSLGTVTVPANATDLPLVRGGSLKVALSLKKY